MAVEYIKWKNKKYPIKIGYNAIVKLQQEYGASMDAIQGDLSLYKPLVFYSLEIGHEIQKKELTLTMDDMKWLLEDCFWDVVGLIPKFFPDEMSKMMEEAGTKKSTSTSSAGTQ